MLPIEEQFQDWIHNYGYNTNRCPLNIYKALSKIQYLPHIMTTDSSIKTFLLILSTQIFLKLNVKASRDMVSRVVTSSVALHLFDIDKMISSSICREEILLFSK